MTISDNLLSHSCMCTSIPAGVPVPEALAAIGVTVSVVILVAVIIISLCTFKIRKGFSKIGTEYKKTDGRVGTDGGEVYIVKGDGPGTRRAPPHTPEDQEPLLRQRTASRGDM